MPGVCASFAAVSKAFSTPPFELTSTFVSSQPPRLPTSAGFGLLGFGRLGRPMPPAPPAVPAVIVMFSAVTSIVGSLFASRIRSGELSSTSFCVEWMWPTSMSPSSSVSMIFPFVRMKICDRSITRPGSSASNGAVAPQSTSVFAVTWMVVSGVASVEITCVPSFTEVVAQLFGSSPPVVTWQTSMSSAARRAVKT